MVIFWLAVAPYNFLFLVKYFSSRIKCAFKLWGGWYSKQGLHEGNKKHGPHKDVSLFQKEVRNVLQKQALIQ